MEVRLPDARHLPDLVLEALRLRALHARELGFLESDIAAILGVARETVSRWWSAYVSGGLDSIPGDPDGRPGRGGCCPKSRSRRCGTLSIVIRRKTWASRRRCGRGGPSVELNHNRFLLSVRPGTTTDKRHEIVEAWYRERVRQETPALIARWEARMEVAVARFFVQRMKTRWGTCNPTARTIRLNTDLARKPRECLEYIVVHEMCHLLEPTHNDRFVALMDRFLPRWRFHRETLNRLPVRHEDWDY